MPARQRLPGEYACCRETGFEIARIDGRAIDAAAGQFQPQRFIPAFEGELGGTVIRLERQGRHAGQPAFPGGAIEAADHGPVGAALREAAEEAGVDPAGVEVLTPVRDPAMIHRLRDHVLATYLRDNVKARQMHSNGTYTRKKPAGTRTRVNVQDMLIARRVAKKKPGEHTRPKPRAES